MGIADSLDISPSQRKTLVSLLNRHIPGVTVWAYGSRVKWTSRPDSDLDLVAFVSPEKRGRISSLKEAFEDSSLPFRVDLMVWDEVPENFRKNIMEQYLVLVEKASEESQTHGGKRHKVAFERLLVTPVRNGIYKPKEFHGRGMKIVNMGELFAHPRLRSVPMKRVELSSSETERFSLLSGDLLFARRSLTAEGAGKCCIVLDVDEPTTYESSIIRARPDSSKADSLFLYYFFNSPSGLHALDTIRRHVAVAGITGTDLASLEIFVPSLPEQRAIAHILATLDDKIELNRRMNETLETMARALFKSWFVDFKPVRAKAEGRDTGLPKEIADLFPDSFEDSELGKVPKGWRVQSFADTVEIIGGGTPKTSVAEYWDGDIPWFSVVDTPNDADVFATDTQKKISQEGLEGSSTRLLPEGTTIISARGTVGKVALVGMPMAMNQSCYGLHSLDDSHFFTYYSTRDLVETLKQRSHGSVFDTITRDTLAGITTVVPSGPIKRTFELKVTPIMQRIKVNLHESRTLAAQRDTLLPKLLSGEIRTPNMEAHLC